MENLHDLASKSFTYKPPLSLQSLQIWSLVIARSREEKVSEFNFTRKSPFALNTWEKRIRIDQVDVSKSEDSNIKCNIYIKFTVVSTNLTDSFIYPFYEKLIA